jgi:phenylacetic acid degradation operon negative regulatory protein
MKRTTAIALEETLTLLVYCTKQITMPSLRDLNQGYEGWLFRNGLLQRLHYLEAQKFLERERARTGWVWQLTQAGRNRADVSLDPSIRWDRPWDGWWRLIIFDLPTHEHRARASLVRWLRENGFGYLQDSVWIRADPVDELAATLKQHQEDAASFTVLESRCVRGFSNAGLVAGAWPFARINDAYRVYISFARRQLRSVRRRRQHPRDLFAVLRAERSVWREAFERDPLLPRCLWPSGYAGPAAWRLRRRLLTGLTSRVLSL